MSKLLECLLAKPDSHSLTCFEIERAEWVEMPSNTFIDNEAFLPPLYKHPEGYRSSLLTVLTSRSSAYGPLLAACTGFAILSNDADEKNILNEITWSADDGEMVVGWMDIPVFNREPDIAVKHNKELDKGFCFLMN